MPLGTVVFFDLKTTGLGIGCDIIQLAAINAKGDYSFNEYVMPEKRITPGATRVTGFSVRGGSLLWRRRVMPTIHLDEALNSFINFLQFFKRPVLLAAHSARRFDVPILKRALHECCLMEEFELLDTWFLDTLPLSRALYPQLDSYSQRDLVWSFLNGDYDAHDALEDVYDLQELYRYWNPNPLIVNQYSFY